MSLIVHTARISTRDPDRFDVTRSGAWRWAKREGKAEDLAPSHPFAPSLPLLMSAKKGVLTFGEYERMYTSEMRASYIRNRAAWDALLARPRVVMFCYEVDARECHRSLLASILVKLGATYAGELS